jgi:hypothetical protein
MLSNFNDEHIERHVMKAHTSSILATSSQRSGIFLSLIVGMELCQEAGKLFLVYIPADCKIAGSGDLKARDRPDARL